MIIVNTSIITNIIMNNKKKLESKKTLASPNLLRGGGQGTPRGARGRGPPKTLL